MRMNKVRQQEIQMNKHDTAGNLIDMVVKIVVAILVVILIYRGALLAYGYGYRVLQKNRLRQVMARSYQWR